LRVLWCIDMRRWVAVECCGWQHGADMAWHHICDVAHVHVGSPVGREVDKWGFGFKMGVWGVAEGGGNGSLVQG
jgi:hypothetical protein